MGVATGILVDLSKRLIEWSRARMSEHKSQEDAIEEAFKSSQAVENGIELLSRQGVKTTEARAALELLKQAIAETVVEKKSGGHI